MLRGALPLQPVAVSCLSTPRGLRAAVRGCTSRRSFALRVAAEGDPEPCSADFGRDARSACSAARYKDASSLDELAASVAELIASAVAGEEEYAAELSRVAPTHSASARNLVHFLRLRRANLQFLQLALQQRGLSSMGSAQSHVIPTLLALQVAIEALRGRPTPESNDSAAGFEQAFAQLDKNASSVLGPAPKAHRARIIVTAPGEAADDPAVLESLLAGGTDILRINCAHDGAQSWARMVRHLRAAEARQGHRRCMVQFDLAGPKLRTGPIATVKARWKQNERLLLHASDAAPVPDDEEHLVQRLPLADCAQLLVDANVGESIWVGPARRREFIVEALGPGWASVIAQTKGSASAGACLTLEREGCEPLRASIDASLASIPGSGLRIKAGDTLTVRLGTQLGTAPSHPGDDFHLSIDVPAVFESLSPGHSICLDDGKFVGVVLQKSATEFRARLTRVARGSAKLAGEKGINLPDTRLALPALSADDRADLQAVLDLRPDLVALSFVQSVEDVEELHALLDAHPNGADVAVVLKIETAAAFDALPSLLLAAMRRPRGFAVMVARGDLGVEVGYGRLSEVQEEMLWLCEAAHAPAVWATQVLEKMAKDGVPSRGEVTDAAFAGRAEAVMLNKGPWICDVLELLHEILARMQTHGAA